MKRAYLTSLISLLIFACGYSGLGGINEIFYGGGNSKFQLTATVDGIKRSYTGSGRIREYYDEEVESTALALELEGDRRVTFGVYERLGIRFHNPIFDPQRNVTIQYPTGVSDRGISVFVLDTVSPRFNYSSYFYMVKGTIVFTKLESPHYALNGSFTSGRASGNFECILKDAIDMRDSIGNLTNWVVLDQDSIIITDGYFMFEPED